MNLVGAALAQNADGRLECVTVGSDGNLYDIYQMMPGGEYDGWTSLGQPTGTGLAGGVGMSVDPDGRLEATALGTDGSLYDIYQTTAGSDWLGWPSLGQPSSTALAGGVGMAPNANEALVAFTVGKDGNAWYIWQTSPGKAPWSAWSEVGAPPHTSLAGPAGIALNGDGRLEACAVGGDGRLWDMWETPGGTWSGWESLGAPSGLTVGTCMGIGANADGRLEVFSAGSDGNLWHIWQTVMGEGGPWSGWASLGAPSGTTVAGASVGVAANADGRLEVCAVCTDGDLYHAWQTSPGGAWSAWESLEQPGAATTLTYTLGTGANDYVACVVGPSPAPGSTKNDFRSPALRVLNRPNPLPAGGVGVEVPAGTPSLSAGLRDPEGNVPQGVTVTVTKPDGTVLDQATEPYASGLVVLMQNGSLVALTMDNPDVGTWNVAVTSSDPEVEFEFFFSTTPSAAVQATIDATLSGMSDQEALTAVGAELGISWGCFWCKFGVYAVAVAVVALCAAGIAYVSAATAPVAALAAYLGMSSAAVVSLVTGVATAISASVGLCAAYICYWATACSQPGA
jgi:hypothetical protein